MSKRTILSAMCVMMLGAFSASAVTNNPASAEVNAVVDAINTLTTTFYTDVSGEASANAGMADFGAIIASGIIDNNAVAGWQLTVESANAGVLIKTGGATTNSITYTSVKLLKTGGVLGTGLTDPTAGTGSVTNAFEFNTATKAASSATQAYAFTLNIGWTADLTLVAGTYRDTITLTLADDI